MIVIFKDARYQTTSTGLLRSAKRTAVKWKIN